MREYTTEAVVLTFEPNGDLDGRFALYTKQFGKLIAKAKSVRRVTSKLAAHLQPGNAVRVRLVEKNGLQVVDALKSGEVELVPSDLYLLSRLLPEAEPEDGLWHMIRGGDFSWRAAVALLGWDPEHARCAGCGAHEPPVFRLASQEFFCKACALKLGGNEVIYVR